MSKTTIELFTPEGEVKPYKLFSARLPEFLRAYPKSEGYRVSVETSDPMSSKPALLKLYEAAISAGKNPTEVGLPPIPSGDVLVFKASLIDKDGTVLESATSLRVISVYKDWEKGETAARQRLIAALGFGGESFDADELSDIEDQGLKVVDTEDEKAAKDTKKKASSSKPAAGKKAQAKPQGEQTEEEEEEAVEEEEVAYQDGSQADDSQSTGTDSDQHSSQTKPNQQKDTPKQQAKQADVKDDQTAEKGEVIPDRLIRQIEHQAKLKDLPVPTFSTVKEAKQALKTLMQS